MGIPLSAEHKRKISEALRKGGAAIINKKASVANKIGVALINKGNAGKSAVAKKGASIGNIAGGLIGGFLPTTIPGSIAGGIAGGIVGEQVGKVAGAFVKRNKVQKALVKSGTKLTSSNKGK